MNLLAAAGFSKGSMINYPHLIRVAELLPFLYPPLIFFYTHYILYPEKKLSSKYWLLFFPLVAGLFVLSPFFIKSAAEKTGMYKEMLIGNYPFSLYILFVAKSAYGITVLFICFFKVNSPVRKRV